MKNTEEFGRRVLAERGQRSQTDVDQQGGPYRQLLSRIENGDDIDITDATLTKIDNALHWTPGFAEALLYATQPAPDTPEQLHGQVENPHRLLGYNRHGDAIEGTNLIACNLAFYALFPMLAARSTTTLVDINVVGPFLGMVGISNSGALAKLVEQWPGRTTRTGVLADDPRLGGADLDPIAIDPIRGIESLTAARRLAKLALATHLPNRGPQASELGLTLFAKSVQLATDSTLNGHKLLTTDSTPLDFWKHFINQSGISEIAAAPADCTHAFQGILEANDVMIDLHAAPDLPTQAKKAATEYENGFGPRRVNPVNRYPECLVEIVNQPTPAAPADLHGALIVFDSGITPELHDIMEDRTQGPITVVTARGWAPDDNSSSQSIVITSPDHLEKYSTQHGAATLADYNRTTGVAVYTGPPCDRRRLNAAPQTATAIHLDF